MGELGYTSKAWLPKGIRESASNEELLTFLNSILIPEPTEAVGMWHLTSLVQRNGKHYVLDDDQIALIAATKGEAHAYLLGRATATTFVMHMCSGNGQDGGAQI